MSIERVENVRRDRGECAAFGTFQLFPSERLLEREGAPVDVGGHAMDVLIALVTQAGRVVSKADLLASVWPDTTVVDGALRVHVSNLRKALGDGVNGFRACAVRGRVRRPTAGGNAVPVSESCCAISFPAAPDPVRRARPCTSHCLGEGGEWLCIPGSRTTPSPPPGTATRR
jgi:hypothetical protein